MSGRQDPLRVAVVGGGRSVEHDVSLASAAALGDALVARGHRVDRWTIGPDGGWRGPAGPVDLGGAVRDLGAADVVLPALHGPHGEDGTLAALCELAGLAYAGSGVGAGALAMDKWATRAVAAEAGIAVAPGVLVTAADAAACDWTHPVVVKPVAAGSSHGVALVTRADDLAPALAAALRVDDRVLVEDVVVGREIDVAVLGRPDGTRLVPPVLEVVTDGLFDLATKYDGSADLRVPADVTPGEVAVLRAAALTTYDALGCRGLARVDFFLTDDGPVLIEVNTAPGATAQSQVPRMFAAAGTSYGELVEMLVRDAVVERSPSARGAA